MYCNTLTVLQLKGLGKARLYCDTVPSQATIRPGGAQAVGAGVHWARSRRRRGRWGTLGAQQALGLAGRQARGRWASWRWRVARAGALQAGGRAGRAAGARGASGKGARGARQERQALGRAGGDTTMLECDTAEGPAATRPQLLRHGASARSARGHARPGRDLGAGWAYWLGQLGQVGALCTWLSSDSVFGPGSTQYYS